MFLVRAGTVNRWAEGETYEVSEILVHEEYGNFLNDVAIIILKTPLNLGPNIGIIEIADKEVSAGAKVEVSGWGRLSQGGLLPYHLQYTHLTAITAQECLEKIKHGEDCLLCLDHPVDNGVCNGDSGGPAVYEGKVVGIAGFVYGGCGRNNPDGYAKVFYHRQWILDHMI